MQNFGVRLRRTAIKILIPSLFFFIPLTSVSALQIQDFITGAENNGITAQSYLVIDNLSGQILLQKNSQTIWVPASLTKLVTAMVLLDNNSSLSKNISMVKRDEVGGARVAAKAGVSYKIKDLFNAMLVGSANNAANAIARSTGLSREKFVEEMNEKAKDLGAQNTKFADPSGISEKSYTTAEDFARIAKVAFSNPLIVRAAQMSEYSFISVNNKRYRHRIKNTNKLLTDGNLNIIAGKTGYLDESRYNFTALTKDQFGQENIVVLLGAKNSQSQFGETKQLSYLAALARPMLSLGNWVLGTSSASTINN